MEENLYIDLKKTAYLPGEVVQGEILWALKQTPETLRLTFGWWTEGKGTQNGSIEAELSWETQATAGSEAFVFTLPASPYSFSGHLIALIWGLELTVKKGPESAIQTFTVGITDQPIELPLIDEG